MEKWEGEIKNISEASLKLTFGQLTVVNEIFLDQTQTYIDRNFPTLEIKFIFNNKSYLITISLEVSAIAVIQFQI